MRGFPEGTSGKEPPANAGDLRDMGLEESTAAHCGILAWRIP